MIPGPAYGGYLFLITVVKEDTSLFSFSLKSFSKMTHIRSSISLSESWPVASCDASLEIVAVNVEWVSEHKIFTALLTAFSMAPRVVEGSCTVCTSSNKPAIGCVSRFGHLPVRLNGIAHRDSLGGSSERILSAVAIIASMPRLLPMVTIELLIGRIGSVTGDVMQGDSAVLQLLKASTSVLLGLVVGKI